MRWLLKLLPRWEVAFYFTIAASATAQIVQARNVAENEALRQRELKNERRQAELAALDEENERLRMLDAANSDAIARAGSLDPFASPSLLALRAANFRTANQDIANIRTNLASTQASVSTRIMISRNNARTAMQSGLLDALATAGSGIAKGSELFGSGGPIHPTKAPAKPKKG